MRVERFDGEWRWLSNFYPAAIVDTSGAVWPTVEHAYQAMKTLDPAERELVRGAESAGAAKRAGRALRLRPDWNEIRIDVMRKLVLAKFRQHPELASRLMATGDAVLIEGNGWGDEFWGVCHGVGENWLGRVLMDTREILRDETREEVRQSFAALPPREEPPPPLVLS